MSTYDEMSYVSGASHDGKTFLYFIYRQRSVGIVFQNYPALGYGVPVRLEFSDSDGENEHFPIDMEEHYVSKIQDTRILRMKSPELTETGVFFRKCKAGELDFETEISEGGFVDSSEEEADEAAEFVRQMDRILRDAFPGFGIIPCEQDEVCPELLEVKEEMSSLARPKDENTERILRRIRLKLEGESLIPKVPELKLAEVSADIVEAAFREGVRVKLCAKKTAPLGEEDDEYPDMEDILKDVVCSYSPYGFDLKCNLMGKATRLEIISTGLFDFADQIGIFTDYTMEDGRTLFYGAYGQDVRWLSLEYRDSTVEEWFTDLALGMGMFYGDEEMYDELPEDILFMPDSEPAHDLMVLNDVVCTAFPGYAFFPNPEDKTSQKIYDWHHDIDILCQYAKIDGPTEKLILKRKQLELELGDEPLIPCPPALSLLAVSPVKAYDAISKAVGGSAQR